MFLKKSLNFHDPWVGTDTTGPGEAVFAIRFDVKPVFLLNILNFRTPKFRSKRVNRESETRIQCPDLRIRFPGDFGVQNPNLQSKMSKSESQR